MRFHKTVSAMLLAVFVVGMLAGCARKVVHAKRPVPPSRRVVVVHR